jgi:hypothetical protein
MSEQEYRQDGWPYCPRCTNDELHSSVMMAWNGDSPRPTLAECHEQEFGCYYCQWRGKIPAREEVQNAGG